jgi:hypothetical protein
VQRKYARQIATLDFAGDAATCLAPRLKRDSARLTFVANLPQQGKKGRVNQLISLTLVVANNSVPARRFGTSSKAWRNGFESHADWDVDIECASESL